MLTMEEKQLDFNRPLLSIRRPTQASESETKPRSSDSLTNKIPPSSPPVYKSDIKSGPVRNPGTVPFQWEHMPGKPKDESQSFVEPHFVPKLPPGRVMNCKEGEVSVRKHATRDSDETYLDAAESFFFNCSNVSGGHGRLVEPFGNLSSDRQTQDLMMGRFLPAAKALTSETSEMMKKENPYRFLHSPEQQEEDGDISSMMASGVCGLLPQICLRSSFGALSPVPSLRMQAHRAVSVRRMRSKYQDATTLCNENQNKQNNESVSEDKMKLKPNGSVAQQGKDKVENSCSISTTPRTKVSKNFGELLATDDNTWKPSSETPVAEKTLYVDTVHSVDKKVQEESMEQPSLVVVATVKEEVQNMTGPGEEDISQPKATDQNVKRDEDVTAQAIVALPVEIITKEKIDLEVKFQRNTMNLERSRLQHRSTYHSVPAPPLPKAPSDSWLKRTLPTIPSKNNSFTWLQSLGAYDNHLSKTNEASPKWETMVKTFNTHQGFVCFSKESLNPIPEA